MATTTTTAPPPPPKDESRFARHGKDADAKDAPYFSASDDDDDEGSDLEHDPLEKHSRNSRTAGNNVWEPLIEEGAPGSANQPAWAGKQSRWARWSRKRCAIAAVPGSLMLAMLGIAIFAFIEPDTTRDIASTTLPFLFNKQAGPSRYAFATYVSGYDRTEFAHLYNGANDQFLDGARVINYQLKHSPSTKSRPDLDFVVLVGQNVTEKNRDMLTREGARVVVAEPLTPKWVRDWYGDGRWGTVMDKFMLAKMTEYEKICFFDADMVITRRMDALFDDPATATIPNKGNPDKVDQNDAPQPEEYMFAAVQDRTANDNHTSETFEYLNAGFFCWHPSQEVFDYYMRFLNRERSFLPIYPEQNMLNLVHNQNGNLPFSRLNWIWNGHRPKWLDLMRGVFTYHAKAWLPDMRYDTVYPELHRIWWYQKREMEAYYADIGLHDRGPEDGSGKVEDIGPMQLIPEPPPGYIVTPPMEQGMTEAEEEVADVDISIAQTEDASVEQTDATVDLDEVWEEEKEYVQEEGSMAEGEQREGEEENEDDGTTFAKRALAAGFKRSMLVQAPDGRMERLVM